MKNLIFFLFVITSVSCKKNALKQTSVDGRVKNAVNEELLSISLFNTMGEKIKEFSPTDQTHSIIELTKGMYWLEIIDINNLKYVVKIIKN